MGNKLLWKFLIDPLHLQFAKRALVATFLYMHTKPTVGWKFVSYSFALEISAEQQGRSCLRFLPGSGGILKCRVPSQQTLIFGMTSAWV